MSVTDNKAVVKRPFDEVWNGRRFDVIDELYAADYVADYRPYAPLREGRDTVREMVERAWTTMPGYHEELLAMVAEGDAVDNLAGLRQVGVMPTPSAGS